MLLIWNNFFFSVVKRNRVLWTLKFKIFSLVASGDVYFWCVFNFFFVYTEFVLNLFWLNNLNVTVRWFFCNRILYVLSERTIRKVSKKFCVLCFVERLDDAKKRRNFDVFKCVFSFLFLIEGFCLPWNLNKHSNLHVQLENWIWKLCIHINFYQWSNNN